MHPAAQDADAHTEEHFDVLNPDGTKTGRTKARSEVHRDGDWHRAVHVWILCAPTGEVVLQRRAPTKDAWANLLDISTAGHVSAGDEPLPTARRETAEEIGLALPDEAFEHAFDTIHQSVTNEGAFINNEHINVFLITLLNRVELGVLALQASEVSELMYCDIDELLAACKRRDPQFVPMEFDEKYAAFFEAMKQRKTRLADINPADIFSIQLSKPSHPDQTAHFWVRPHKVSVV